MDTTEILVVYMDGSTEVITLKLYNKDTAMTAGVRWARKALKAGEPIAGFETEKEVRWSSSQRGMDICNEVLGF